MPATNTPVSSAMDQTDSETLNWLIGWAIIGTAAYLISRTKAGYAAIYYSLLLLVLLVLITQSRFILSEVQIAISESVPDSGGSQAGSTCSGEGFCWTADNKLGKCVNGKCVQTESSGQHTLSFDPTNMGPGGIITL